MEEDSPLQFLDTDCSRYLYETYYPSSAQRAQQDRVIQELRCRIKRYTIRKFNRSNRLGPGIERLFGPGETGWVWSSISARGSRVGQNFPITCNGNGTGFYQFSEETRWTAKEFPPHIDHYYGARGFIRHLRFARRHPSLGHTPQRRQGEQQVGYVIEELVREVEASRSAVRRIAAP